MFRRDLLIDAGGYDRTTVGEDAELVVRLHRTLRQRRQPYRIVFLPDPVCWTQVPMGFRDLARQRDRWHRGLAEALWRHRSLIANPRYGIVGFLQSLLLRFELLGPIIETLGYGLLAFELITRTLVPWLALAFLALAIVWGSGVLLRIAADRRACLPPLQTSLRPRPPRPSRTARKPRLSTTAHAHTSTRFHLHGSWPTGVGRTKTRPVHAANPTRTTRTTRTTRRPTRERTA